MSIRNRLLTIFIMLIVFILISFFVNQSLSAEVIRNGAELNRSEAVIRNSNQIHKTMIDMQSGYRGFLLTGEDDFLKSYDEGRPQIPKLIAEQHVLITLVEQRSRLDTIFAIHQRWLKYSDHLIKSKKDTLPGADWKFRLLFEKKVKKGTGKKMNDQIHAVFLSFDRDEYDLRYQRRLIMQKSIRANTRIQLALASSSTVLAVLFSLYLTHFIARRINSMVQFANEIAKGNFIRLKDERVDEITQLSDSLNAMSDTLNATFQQLTKKNNELDQFAYVVSHDLKAPLRGIENLSTWIEEDHGNELTPEVNAKLQLIKGRTRRLENMINGLLDYARIDKMLTEPEMVDVWQLINEQFELLVPSSFIVRLSGDFPRLFTVRVHIEQVFSNLISNAVKYNDKKEPMVVISCLKQKQYYRFTVEDNGEGIQPAYYENIFTIFQTLKERDAFESNGVGLAIVKRIIERKNALIEVKSEPGERTVFTFTWPINDPDVKLISENNEKNIVS